MKKNKKKFLKKIKRIKKKSSKKIKKVKKKSSKKITKIKKKSSKKTTRIKKKILKRIKRVKKKSSKKIKNKVLKKIIDVNKKLSSKSKTIQKKIFKKKLNYINKKIIKKKIKVNLFKKIKFKEKIIGKLNIKIFVLKFFDPIVGAYNKYVENRKNQKTKLIAEKRARELFEIEKEKKNKEHKVKLDEKLRIELREKELKQEIRIAKERDRDIKNFLRKEQAEIRREQAERQRKFLIELKLEKQIEKFQIREIKELENLEKISLKEQREDYSALQARIDKLKEKYRAIRDEKIKERVAALGVQIQEGDDREALLQKERLYRIERHKIENCLESFYRSSASLCFQINKRYIPKHKSILRCIDRRFENGEIFIKWDDSPEEEWLLLIYIKNNSPEDGVVIEDKTNLEKNISHEFKTNEIFKASDTMVDALTQLLERERSKKAS